MRATLILGAMLALSPFVVQPASAGCIKGALVGGVVGHLAGHGGVGAAAGCAIGHQRSANKAARANNYQAAPAGDTVRR